MNKAKALLNLAMLFGILTLLINTSVQAEPTIEHVMGKLDYYSFCAACHGNDGKDNGPKDAKLSATPTDLTMLSKANGGSFPETAVYNIIDGRRAGDFHGQEMPIWGEHFKEIEGNEEVVHDRISNLIEYLKYIQDE